MEQNTSTDAKPNDDTKPKDEQTVTPWNVEGGIKGVDYSRLIKDFGTVPIPPEMIARVEKLTGKPAHSFLKRGLFFSHRSLDELLDAFEKKQPFYLYTGRGPSSEALHLGHMVPFIFTRFFFLKEERCLF